MFRAKSGITQRSNKGEGYLIAFLAKWKSMSDHVLWRTTIALQLGNSTAPDCSGKGAFVGRRKHGFPFTRIRM